MRDLLKEKADSKISALHSMIEYRAAHDIVSRVVRESPGNSGGGLSLKGT